MTEVTLEELLVSREKRAAMQKQLLEAHHCPLVCFTVVMPGKEKLNGDSRFLFERGCEEIERAISDSPVFFLTEQIKKTGCEAYFSVGLDEWELKKRMIEIEEGHPLGRLFDIDVISLSGRPLSRAEYGLPERKCLICGDLSAVCAKARKHSTEEIRAVISEMIRRYRFERKK